MAIATGKRSPRYGFTRFSSRPAAGSTPTSRPRRRGLRSYKGPLATGLSPEQLPVCNGGPVNLSPSTIYRWVSASHDDMTDMELRQKVGYRPRKCAAGRAASRHSARNPNAAFPTLGEEALAAILGERPEETRLSTATQSAAIGRAPARATTSK